MRSDEIKQRAYEEIQAKLDLVPDGDKGTYFHGWFDCLYFVGRVLKENDFSISDEEIDRIVEEAFSEEAIEGYLKEVKDE